jgi:hypothetical protein
MANRNSSRTGSIQKTNRESKKATRQAAKAHRRVARAEAKTQASKRRA